MIILYIYIYIYIYIYLHDINIIRKYLSIKPTYRKFGSIEIILWEYYIIGTPIYIYI